jgi:uncharacterized protein (DUF1501 family)
MTSGAAATAGGQASMAVGEASPTTCQSCGPSRRSVLQAALAGGALGVVESAVGGTASARYAFAGTAYTGDVVVVLSLRGGFDGLSAVVPRGDPAYYTLRPTIGIPRGALLGVDAMWGLHPRLAPLWPLWQSGRFGAVHAVGQADPTRSHFEAMAEMERAAPGTSTRSGWLDRTLGLRAGGTVFQAVQVGSTQTPAALYGPNAELAIQSIDAVDLDGEDDWLPVSMRVTLQALHADAPARIAQPAAAALGAVRTTTALKAAGYPPSGGAVYPSTDLGRALRDVVRLVKARVGLQVACIDYGDWDMHADLGTLSAGRMIDQLDELARALAAFAIDLGPALAGVTLVTLSEFGRRVEENGSAGTDHGHGNAVLLLGGGVVGGRVHGRWPGLADEQLVDGDLAGVVDYRLILGEILQKRCGVGSLAGVFPGLAGSPLGVVRPRTS